MTGRLLPEENWARISRCPHSDEEWDRSVKHLVAALDKFNLPSKEKDEVLGAIGSLKRRTSSRRRQP